MAGDLPAAVDVVVEDRIIEVFSPLMVHHHHREPVLRKLPALLGVEGGGADDHSVGPVLHQRLDDFLLPGGIVLRGGNEQAVSGLLGDLFDPEEDFAEEGIVDAADDDAKLLGAVGLQAAGSRGRQVGHFLGCLADAFGGLLRDEGITAQRARNRGVRDSGALGNIFDRSGHGRWKTCTRVQRDILSLQRYQKKVNTNFENILAMFLKKSYYINNCKNYFKILKIEIKQLHTYGREHDAEYRGHLFGYWQHAANRGGRP